MDKNNGAWSDIIRMPLSSRIKKPRSNGLTMVMDKGLGLQETLEMLSVASEFIDYVKLAFGTPALYKIDLLKRKIAAVRSHGIHIYPGGTFLEVAVIQNKVDDFLSRAKELGFSAIEVSDGTITMSPYLRRNIIGKAGSLGFHVLSEVGKKDPENNVKTKDMINQVNADLEAGVNKVIVEARESGKNIGVFDNKGAILKDRFDEIVAGIDDQSKIIWEAPLKSQQQELILQFGPNVNVGNISPSEILALEALRVGLRSDTLKALSADPDKSGMYDC